MTSDERIAWLEQKLRETVGECVIALDRIAVLEAGVREIQMTADPYGVECICLALLGEKAKQEGEVWQTNPSP
jgi:hypothetical protein